MKRVILLLVGVLSVKAEEVFNANQFDLSNQSQIANQQHATTNAAPAAQSSTAIDPSKQLWSEILKNEELKRQIQSTRDENMHQVEEYMKLEDELEAKDPSQALSFLLEEVDQISRQLDSMDSRAYTSDQSSDLFAALDCLEVLFRFQEMRIDPDQLYSMLFSATDEVFDNVTQYVQANTDDFKQALSPLAADVIATSLPIQTESISALNDLANEITGLKDDLDALRNVGQGLDFQPGGTLRFYSSGATMGVHDLDLPIDNATWRMKCYFGPSDKTLHSTETVNHEIL